MVIQRLWKLLSHKEKYRVQTATGLVILAIQADQSTQISTPFWSISHSLPTNAQDFRPDELLLVP